MSSNNRANGFSVRCLKDWFSKGLTSLEIKPFAFDYFFMDKLLIDLFRAYYDARRNKRSTVNVLAFEIDYERKLFGLYQEIKSGKYKTSFFWNFILKKYTSSIFPKEYPFSGQ